MPHFSQLRGYRRWLPVFAVILVGLFVQGYVLTLEVPPFHDVDEYFVWGKIAVESGFGQVYSGWPPVVSYPPVTTHAFGAMMLVLGSSAIVAEFTLLLKVVQMALTVAIAVGIYRVCRQRVGPGVATLAVGLFILNPGVIFVSMYWGQFDLLYTFLILTALLMYRKPEMSLPFAALAVLTKPQALPFAMVVFLVPVFAKRLRQVWQGSLIALATIGIVLMPFIYDRSLNTLESWSKYVVGLQPAVSNSAHNFWWVITGSSGRKISDTEQAVSWLPVSHRNVGYALFLVCAASTLYIFARRVKDVTLTQVLSLSAVVGFAFFFFITKVHENHTFALVPVTAVLATSIRAWRWPFVLISWVLFWNVILHDPYLGRTFFDVHIYPRVSWEVLTWLNAVTALVAFAFFVHAFLSHIRKPQAS